MYVSYEKLDNKYMRDCASAGAGASLRIARPVGRSVLWSLELESEFYRHFFASDFGVKEPDSALVTKAKFQKDHGRERCADGIKSGIAEMQIWSRKIGGEIPDSAGRHSRERAIAVVKEFGMAEGNFVTTNVRSGVKEFATEMQTEIAFLLSVFSIRTASPITSS